MPYKNLAQELKHRKEYYEKNKEKICESKRARYISPIKIGDVYGDLTVVSPMKSYRNISSYGHLSSRKMWGVRCSCGKIFTASGTRLRRGDAVMCVSCACKTRVQSTARYGLIELLYRSTERSAKKRGIIFNLHIDDFTRLVQSDCFYCGCKPQKRKTRYRGIDIYANGIDRVNTHQNYEIGNCVPCCLHCNIAKHTMSQEEFYSLIKRIFFFKKLDDRPKRTPAA